MSSSLIQVSSYRPGGISSSLDVTTTGVIKASSGCIYRIISIAEGSGGSLTLNDTTTTGGASAANEFFTIAYTGLTVGTVIFLAWPCQNGIVISAVPSGSPIIAVAYS